MCLGVGQQRGYGTQWGASSCTHVHSRPVSHVVWEGGGGGGRVVVLVGTLQPSSSHHVLLLAVSRVSVFFLFCFVLFCFGLLCLVFPPSLFDQEVKECTFKPEIHPSPGPGVVSRRRRRPQRRSSTSTDAATAGLPRGYAKSINRMRKGQAQRAETKKVERQLSRVRLSTVAPEHFLWMEAVLLGVGLRVCILRVSCLSHGWPTMRARVSLHHRKLQGMVSKKALVRDARGNTKVEPFSLATSKRRTQRQRQRAETEAKRRERMQFIAKAKAEAHRAAALTQAEAKSQRSRARQQAEARQDAMGGGMSGGTHGVTPSTAGYAPSAPGAAVPSMDTLMPNTFGNVLVAPLMFVDVNITPEVRLGRVVGWWVG